MRLSCLPESATRPYRLFGSPVPLRRSSAPEVFRLASSPFLQGRTASSHRLGPSSETPLGAARPPVDRSLRATSSSREVLRPFSVLRSSDRLASKAVARTPVRAPSLPGLSQTLEGLIPVDPCGLVACRCRSWGSPLQSISLPADSSGLVTRRSLLDVSTSAHSRSRVPKGFRTASNPTSTTRVLHRAADRCSPGFSALPWRSGRVSWLRLPTVHPLLVFASEPFWLVPEVDLQRLPDSRPGVSRSRGRRPS